MKFFYATCLFIFSMFGRAAERETVFPVSLQFQKSLFTAGNGHELNGDNVSLNAGYGKLKSNYLLFTSIQVILGPYGNHNSSKDFPSTDISGIGLALQGFFDASSRGLRSPAGTFGLSLGLRYMDLTARMFSNSTHHRPDSSRNLDTLPASPRKILNYRLGIVGFIIEPGVYFGQLKPPREWGARESDLETRMEGFVFYFAFGLPLYMRYRASVLLEPQAKVEADAETTEETQTHNGDLAGYYVLFGVMTPLGV